MANASLGLPPDLQAYLQRHGYREPGVLVRLRERTARIPEHEMQVAPEEGALLALLVGLMGARRCLEIGTFTGYSSTAIALAMPPDGRLVCCDVSEEWTTIARDAWAEAGVADRVELRLGPALETLDRMLAEGAEATFDFAFIDANKDQYPDYYERAAQLVRPGGLVAIDNVFRGGDVADPSVDNEAVRATRRLNERIASDDRVTFVMVPIADGLTLARTR